MRRLAVLLVLTVAGCRGGGRVGLPPAIGPHAAYASPVLMDGAATVPARLADLWQAAESSHPELRAAQIDFEASQTQVAAAKRSLETELACAQQQAALLALLQKRFELMHRVRSGFYQFAAAAELLAAYDASLERTAEDVRRMRAAVEEGKTQPRSNLIALEAALEQAKAARAKAELERSAVWRQLVIEVGLSPEAMPVSAESLPQDPPVWQREQVQEQVLAENLGLQQAIQAERVARLTWLQLGRSRWRRRQQSQLIEAEAAVGKAQAAIEQAARTLLQQADAAMAKYDGLLGQWRSLRDVILPQRREQLRLVERQYEIGAMGGTLPELLAARQGLSEAELQLAQVRIQLWQAAAEVEALLQVEIPPPPEEIAPTPPEP
jgi:outer membrane protein TolC